jgi:hypothetical protein
MRFGFKIDGIHVFPSADDEGITTVDHGPI